jgi:hypothetical protein
VKEYLATLDDAAFGAASEVTPKSNLASGLSCERVEGRLGLALRRLICRHMSSLSLVLVPLRFLFFLISFLSLRHGDPPVCSIEPTISSTAGEQLIVFLWCQHHHPAPTTMLAIQNDSGPSIGLTGHSVAS